MHNDSDEFEKNDGSPYESERDDVTGSVRDELREEDSGRRSASHSGWNDNSGESRSGYASRPGDLDRNRVLLRVVNDVLNQHFPLKTLFCGLEFDEFRNEVIEATPGMAEDPAAFISGVRPIKDPSDPEEVDRVVDEVLKDLFFHAGGTLIGDLEERRVRLSKVADYLAKHVDSVKFRLNRRPKMRDDFVLEELYSKVGEPVSDSSGSDKHVHFSNVRGFSEAQSFEDKSTAPSDVQGEAGETPDEEPAEALPWIASYRKASGLVRRFFGGEALEPDEFATFRRLFYLKSEPQVMDERPGFGASSPLESLFEVIKESVDESYPSLKLFDVKSLEGFFDNLNSKVLLEKKSLAEVDEITQIALDFIGLKINPDDEEELTDDSDFSVEFLLIAKFVLNERFRNRHFSPDFSDFGDFYTVFLEVAGPRARATELEVREYFEQAGGRFFEKTVSQEETSENPTMTRGEMIKKVLADDFPAGLKLFALPDLARFRESCKKYGGQDEVDISDDKLRSAICRCATTCDGRAYSIAEKNKKLLKQTVESLTRVGASVIYYEAWFEKNASWLASVNVPNWRVLRALLASCFPRFVFYDYYFETTKVVKFEFLKVLDEINRLWGSAKIRRPDELAERVHVPIDRIVRVLTIDVNDFIPVDNGFAHTTQENVPDVLLGDRELDEKFREPFEYVYPLEGVTGKQFQAILNDEVKNHELGAVVEKVPPVQTDIASAVKELFSQAQKEVHDRKAVRTSKPNDSAEKVPHRTSEKKAPESKGVEGTSSSWRKHANMIAKILSSSFKDGLPISEPNAIKLFRATAEENGLELSESDEEVREQILRVGFLCDDRVFVVSQKSKARVMADVDAWFERGGSVIYFEAFFNRHVEELMKAGIPSVSVLENRLRKYYPDYVFSAEGYFEVREDTERTIDEKIRDDIFSVWDGSSAKRLNELAEVVYVPREKLEETLKDDRTNFDVRSNGYWIRKGGAGKKSIVVRRKSSRR